jgi:hypothetical protein
MGTINLQIPHFFQTVSSDISFFNHLITGQIDVEPTVKSKEHLQTKILFAAIRLGCVAALGLIAVKMIPSLLTGSVIGITVYSIQALLARDIFVIARNFDQNELGKAWMTTKSVWNNVMEAFFTGIVPKELDHPMVQGTVLRPLWNTGFRWLERQYHEQSASTYGTQA